jgi:DNA-binding CsgD family transcriptional regulator
MVSAQPVRCVGRDTELADLLDLVIAGVHGSGRSVLVSGPAGVGKTTLLTRLASAARSSVEGLQVLRIDGLAGEAHVPLAALGMLSWRLSKLGSSPGSAVARLADLLGSGLVDEPVLDNATLQALAETAEHQPLVLVIDDAQWIDPVSARSIVFALRRLDHDALVGFVGSRDDEPTPFAVAGFERRELRGLGIEHADALISAHFGVGAVATDVATTCARRTGGNPLAMIEVVRSIDADQRSGHRALPNPLPVGTRVSEVFGAKVLRLDQAEQLALAILAVGADQPGTTVAAALRAEGVGDGLRRAIVAGIVGESDGDLRLSHPLYHQVILDVVDADDVRTAHLAMAAALGSDPQAAWHVAAAATGPDDDAAESMAAVAALYLSRGDPALAARAYERSAALSSDDRARFGRAVKAGQAWWEASLPLVAIDRLGQLLAEADGPGERAVIAGDLGDALAWRRSVGEGVGILRRSAADVEVTDPDQACVLHLRASLLHGLAGDAEEEFHVAQRAVELAEASPGPLLVAARLVRGLGAQMSGRRDIADHDLALAVLLDDLPTEQIDSTLALVFQTIGVAHMVREEHSAAGRSFARVVAAGEALGQSGVVGFTKACMSEIAFRRGRFVEAIVAGSSDVRSHDPRPRDNDESGRNDPRTGEIGSFGHATFARAAAVTGRIDEALAEALVARRTGDAIDMCGLSAWARAAQGLAFLATDDAAGAAAVLREARLLVNGWTEPSLLWHHGDLFEALALIGADDEIDALAAQLVTRCEATGTRYGAAVAARHRRLGPAPGRRGQRADVDAIRWSIDAFDALGAPFERARSLVALAQATGDVEAALQAGAEFDRMGATAWARRARSSLRAPAPLSSGARAVAAGGQADRPGRPVGLSELTSAELRVSEAVSRGLTNRDIATELFISPKTVEYHLRNIFRKLQLSRRAELVARFHTSDLGTEVAR